MTGVLDRVLRIGAVLIPVALMLVVPFFVRGWRRKVASVALGLAGLVTTIVIAYPGYRRWLDGVRVENVQVIFEVIEHYKAKTGRCPLERQFTGEPMGVNITPRPLPAYFQKPPPGARGFIVPYQELLAELRAGLGPIDLPVDPQKYAFGPPNFYQYQLADGHFSVAASLWFDRPGTKQLGSHYYKYELSASCRQ